jgi:3-oxoacyl-[acyl-carrier-protein] synthase-3
MSRAKIVAVEKFLPSGVLTNEDLEASFPDWLAAKISEKTGIYQRAIANNSQFSSHLGVAAAETLLSSQHLSGDVFDYLIVASQTPDYILPGIASEIHRAIGMKENTGAVDLNVGCSGYVYALGLAQGLIATNQATNLLIVTADTYSKLLNPGDRSVRTIFGDGATATWINNSGDQDSILGLSYGTDGSGAGSLCVPRGGLRNGSISFPKADPLNRGLEDSSFDLYMNGPEVFSFTLRVAEKSIEDTLRRANVRRDDIDFFIFHQANAFMLKHLGAKLGIPENKMPILMRDWGNTVSSTIPMALHELISGGILKQGSRVLVFGFGVGLSWASAVVTI